MEHVVITEPIRIFDCIEFNDRFRYSDTAADIAFLAMDLDFNDREDLSRTLMDAYVKHSGDEGARSLVNFYKVYRAYVRGKVISFLLDSPGPHTQEHLQAAQKYFNLAERYIQEEAEQHSASQAQPNLIITCGLMGTGKSTIAKEVARTSGWKLVSSDEVRKEIAGIPPTHHEYVPWGKGIYSQEFTEKTYNRMNEIAEEQLRRGSSVVLDASFRKKSERAKAYALAKATNAKFTCIELTCPEEIIKRRLTARMEKRGGTSDGRWAIYSDQKANFERVNEFRKEEHIILDTSKPKVNLVTQLSQMLKLRNRP